MSVPDDAWGELDRDTFDELVNATDVIGRFRAWRRAGLSVLASLTV